MLTKATFFFFKSLYLGAARSEKYSVAVMTRKTHMEQVAL